MECPQSDAAEAADGNPYTPDTKLQMELDEVVAATVSHETSMQLDEEAQPPSCSHELVRKHLGLPIVNTPAEQLTRVDGTTQCNNLESSDSMPSISSLVCRICHNADNPELLVSPCLCKGSLTFVHITCLERWISTSRVTICELCQFHYNTEQTLRYTCIQSLRLWYARAISRRALQEDCQMFSLLTLVAFGIIGTLLVGMQYYSHHTQSWGPSKLWTNSWMVFFLIMTVTVYFANIYMLVKSQLTPWYRWWQSARDIKLILENRRPFKNPSRRQECGDATSLSASMYTHPVQLETRVPLDQPNLQLGVATKSKSAPHLQAIMDATAAPCHCQGPFRGFFFGNSNEVGNCEVEMDERMHAADDVLTAALHNVFKDVGSAPNPRESRDCDQASTSSYSGAIV